MKQRTKSRIDRLLVERGLVSSRARAQALIMAGKILVNGECIDKAGREVKLTSEIIIKEELPFVSRAGVKLEGFLNEFEVDVEGLMVIDVGSSTGGFTDCLLKRGAAHVWAVDVGKGLLDWQLRNDNRVTVLEGLNIRYLDPAAIGRLVDLAVVDVSFISLTKVLPKLKELLKSSGRIIALVKPQFEAGRADVGKGGIIKDPDIHKKVLRTVKDFATGIGLNTLAEATSSIKGAKGNVEFGIILELSTEETK